MQIEIKRELINGVVEKMRTDEIYSALLQSFDALEISNTTLSEFLVKSGIPDGEMPRKVSKYFNALKNVIDAGYELKDAEIKRVISGSL